MPLNADHIAAEAGDHEPQRQNNFSLEVYGLDGSLVRTLVNAEQPAGRYVLHWDGRDNAGKSATSGVYFYHLTAGDRTVSGQLILAK